MKKFFTRFGEILLVFFTILVVYLKPTFGASGDRLSILLFGTLAFYYLASGVLTFLDKKRIIRSVRLIYIVGLWGISVIVIGIMCRIILLQGDKELLIVALFSLIGILMFAWLSYKNIEDENNRDAFVWQMQPLVVRSILALIIGAGFLFTDSYTIYRSFGTFRNNTEYINTIVDAYQNPNDTLKVNTFKRLDSELRSAPREKPIPDSTKE